MTPYAWPITTVRRVQPRPLHVRQAHSPPIPEISPSQTVICAHLGTTALAVELRALVPPASTAQLVKVQPRRPTTHVLKDTTAQGKLEFQ